MIPEGMLAHIRHAERWLSRARLDCGRGEARQAVLRLLLAEAEIRRARESGAGETACPSVRPGTPCLATFGRNFGRRVGREKLSRRVAYLCPRAEDEQNLSSLRGRYTE